MNNTLPKGFLQAFFSNNYQTLDSERQSKIKSLFIDNVSTCNKTKKKILNSLIGLTIKYGQGVTPSQDHMSEWLGVDRSTIHRSCKSLVEMGVIKMESGKYDWTSNKYTVSPLFFEFAHELRGVIYALKGFALRLNIQAFLKNATPYIDKFIYNSINSRIVKGVARMGSTLIKSCGGFLKKQEEYDEQQDKLLVYRDEEYIVRRYSRQKGISMSESRSKLRISTPVETIAGLLNLSEWGKVRLMIYPEQSLAYMAQELKTKRGTKSPYNWLLAALDNYCQENNLHVDWDMLPLMKKACGIGQKASYFNDRLVVAQTYVKPKPPVMYTSLPEKVIISPIVGKYKEPHPDWAQFIPADLRVD